MSSEKLWDEVCISNICDSITDCLNRTAPTVDEITPYKMIRTTNIRDGWLNLSSVNYVDREVFEKWTRRQVPKIGDIILTREAPLGEVGMIRSDDNVFLGQRLVSYRINKSKADNRFVFYSFQDPFVQSQIKAFGSGATVEHMRVPDAKKLVFRLPSPPTQRRIASILSAYDDLIENNTRRIVILEEMARRLYEEWFVNFRFPGHETARFVETELGAVPEGWSVGTLKDIVVLQRGYDLPTRSRENGPYPVIASTGYSTTHSESKVKAPCVVTGRTGSIGTVMYITKDFWPLNTTLWGKLYPLESILFAYFSLQSIDFSAFNSGAAVPSLNRNNVHELPFILPSKAIIKEFEKNAEPLFLLMDNLREKNTDLRAQRDLLLPKLISGELDVSEAEDVLEETTV